jgi:hypothetical protein
VRLELAAAHGGDAVGAALALFDVEPLLAGLEQWLGMTLDLAPVSELVAPEPGLVWCSTLQGARLGLPWLLLAQAPPTGMPELHCPELELQVEVERWTELPAQPPSIAQGGLMLLPASFEEPWRVTLTQSALGFEVDAHWAGPGHAPTLAGALRPVSTGAACVRLVQTLRWPLAAALGWSCAPEQPLADAARAWPALARQPSFSGRIVPALRGAALLVAPQKAAVVEVPAATAA